MSQLPCITTTMHGRPCIIRGEHLEACLWAQIEAAAVVEGVTPGMIMQARAEVGLAVPSRECRGCLPRPAEHGLLCDSCYPKWVDALGVAARLVWHLRSVQHGSQSVDGVRTAQGSKVLIPTTWLAADELWSLLSAVAIAYAAQTGKGEPDWPYGVSVAGDQHLRPRLDGFDPQVTPTQAHRTVSDLVKWLGKYPTVSFSDSATAAVEFFRALQTALHRFPIDDNPDGVPLPLLRCRRCRMFTVREHPPLHFLAERVLKCDVCEFEADLLLIDWDLKLYAQEVWEGMTREDRARLLPDLDVDERRVLRELNRSDVETIRAKVWELLGDVYTKPGRVIWYNATRPLWDGMNADQMIEAGRGDEVRRAVERLSEGNIA